jgi:hypothetical protein
MPTLIAPLAASSVRSTCDSRGLGPYINKLQLNIIKPTSIVLRAPYATATVSVLEAIKLCCLHCSKHHVCSVVAAAADEIEMSAMPAAAAVCKLFVGACCYKLLASKRAGSTDYSTDNSSIIAIHTLTLSNAPLISKQHGGMCIIAKIALGGLTHCNW